jgi:hypothetical protein
MFGTLDLFIKSIFIGGIFTASLYCFLTSYCQI